MSYFALSLIDVDVDHSVVLMSTESSFLHSENVGNGQEECEGERERESESTMSFTTGLVGQEEKSLSCGPLRGFIIT